MSDGDGKEEPSEPLRRRLIRGTDLARKKPNGAPPSKLAEHLRRLARGEQPHERNRAAPAPPVQRLGRPVIILRRPSSGRSGNFHRPCSRDRAQRMVLPDTLTPARRREIKTRHRLLMHWKRTLKSKIQGHQEELRKIEKELDGLVDKLAGEVESE
jgi:hypothetical protein